MTFRIWMIAGAAVALAALTPRESEARFGPVGGLGEAGPANGSPLITISDDYVPPHISGGARLHRVGHRGRYHGGYRGGYHRGYRRGYRGGYRVRYRRGYHGGYRRGVRVGIGVGGGYYGGYRSGVGIAVGTGYRGGYGYRRGYRHYGYRGHYRRHTRRHYRRHHRRHIRRGGYYRSGVVYHRPRQAAPRYRARARYEPWSAAWLEACSRRYRTFNPRTGYYFYKVGKQRFCR